MLDRLVTNIKYRIDQPVPGSLINFLWAVRFWWHTRPQRTQCSFCGQPLWWNGPQDPNFPDKERYCSEGCAYYGPRKELDEEVIPF